MCYEKSLRTTLANASGSLYTTNKLYDVLKIIYQQVKQDSDACIECIEKTLNGLFAYTASNKEIAEYAAKEGIVLFDWVADAIDVSPRQIAMKSNFHSIYGKEVAHA